MEQEASGNCAGIFGSFGVDNPREREIVPVLIQIKPCRDVTTEPPDRFVETGCIEDLHLTGGAQGNKWLYGEDGTWTASVSCDLVWREE